MKPSTARAWGWVALGVSAGWLFPAVPWLASVVVAVIGALLIVGGLERREP